MKTKVGIVALALVSMLANLAVPIVAIAADSSPPNQPSKIAPSSGATGISLTPTLDSSAFSDPDVGDTHTASQWQITVISGDYSNPLYNSGIDTINLTPVTIPSGTLYYDTTYYWRVRHQDNHGVWSNWSAETSFATISRVTLTININPTGVGTVILSPTQPEDGYLLETVVTITADPTMSPYQFDHWSGDVSATYYKVSLTMDSNKNVNAHFISTPLKILLDQIQSDVGVWRGLSTLQEIDHWFVTREELSQQLVEEFEEDIEEINVTQEVLVLLDLMEEDQDLYTILIDLYSEAIAGLYDPELAKLYVIGDIEQLDPVEERTYAHEYTHALQDQHFDLSLLDSGSEDNSDLSQAVRSLVEGDASLLEEIYYLMVFDDVDREAYDQLIAQSDGEAFDEVPPIILQDLIFPYTAGKNFVYAIWEEGGWDTVNYAYNNLPQSTEQIIHPEKYLVWDEPQVIDMPDLEVGLGDSWVELDTDVLGELYMRLYLEAFINTAQATTAAEGWDGDRYVYLKDGEGRKLLVLNSVWDSISDAGEFFNAYTTFVAEKSDGTWDSLLKNEGKRWWQSEGLSLYLSQSGNKVLIIIAPDEAIAGQALTEFPEFYASPIANFSVSSTSGDAPLTVHFTDESTGGITDWEWDFDSDGRVDSTEQNPSHTYEFAGNYTVSLRVTGPGGEDIRVKSEIIMVKEKAEDEDGGGFDCVCSRVQAKTSPGELLIGWATVGLCWGTGYYLVRKVSRRIRE